MKIAFKSKLAGIKSIKARNEAFGKLSKSQQRQEIAYDGLKLVVNQKIKASYCEYWSEELADIEVNDSKEFQKQLNTNLPVGCRVCARGLAMLSTIRLADGISSKDDSRMDGDVDNQKYFTMDQMHKMEDEFEETRYKHPYRANSNEKLANIMCNVIANGRFRKDVKTDYLDKWGIEL